MIHHTHQLPRAKGSHCAARVHVLHGTIANEGPKNTLLVGWLRRSAHLLSGKENLMASFLLLVLSDDRHRHSSQLCVE